MASTAPRRYPSSQAGGPKLMRNPAILALVSLLAPTFPADAQDKTAEPAVYKVEFAIRDGSQAAAQAGRRYTMVVSANEKGIFRLEKRCPTPRVRSSRA
ncbi:MAG: hypothetical protein DMG58_21930 [Acidobacteria bacterium]|nr:MAG: hypothetical protein DMG58_21930 [Acidobacteriota bacterium]